MRINRMIAAAFLLSPAMPSRAQSPDTPPSASTAAMAALPELLILGRADSLLGIAHSASQGVVGMKEFEARPILRPGEILETIPGLVITQHSGTGKANQYFLRGFNLDHGTDFATTINGMPVNLPSHGHGQGWSDLNIMTPELVETLRFRKGTYDADQGDFSSAGSADIEYADTLARPLLKLEGGSYGYGRGLFAASPKAGSGRLLYALELIHEDGPWTRPNDGRKANALLRYSRGDADDGLNVTAMNYKALWHSTDQIAQRAVDQGLIGRFGSLDTTDGGDSQRYSLTGQWRRGDDTGKTQVSAYASYYDLYMFSNFTYLLDDPVNGDQFYQTDRRYLFGGKASREWDFEFAGRKVANTVGLQVRNDEISNSLQKTRMREVLSTTRQDRIGELSIAPYAETNIRWFERFRSILGLRGDEYQFRVRSDNTANSGNRSAFLLSPKLALIFGPWGNTEFYLNGNYGFHSNDARGALTRIDPGSGTTVDPVTPLVRTKGAEAGVRATVLPELQSTLSLWYLLIGSELVFSGDAGTTEASRPSRRYGAEVANYYSPVKWLTLDADFSVSEARFTDADPAGSRIPDSIESVVTTGVLLHQGRISSETRLRYFGPRPLIEDNSVRSRSSSLASTRLGYDLGADWNVALDVFNLFDEPANDIEYFYTSRLSGEPAAGVADRHPHPAEPREFRVAVTKRF